MDFFSHQEHARRRTGRLVILFLVGVVLMLAAVYLVVAGVFRHDQFQRHGPAGLWHPQLFAWTTLGTLAIICGASLFKFIELGQGGSVVAASLGGEPVDPHTTDPDLRKLVNVVEEMSIASGVPMPEIYLLPEERGINAFAAGTRPDNAVIGVTEGAVRHLNRDELQGVIAHEFSHILNGDMRLNLRLIGLVFGLLCLMLIGRVLLEGFLRGGSRRRRGGDGKQGNPLPLIVIALALVVIGWLGAFFGRLVQAAVSRQREFLADASAVQFTRNPLGLAGALKKIGGLAYGSKLESAHAGEASHLFFSNGLRESWFGLTSTHPPLEQRIKLLDPSFTGDFATVIADEEKAAVARHYRERPPLPDLPPIPAPPALQTIPGLAIAAHLATKPVSAADLGRALTPAPQHLQFAAGFRAALDPALADACANPLAATAIIYGLLLPTASADSLSPARSGGEGRGEGALHPQEAATASPELASSPPPSPPSDGGEGVARSARAAALAAARAHLDPAAFHELARLDAHFATFDPALKLSLAQLAIPALRSLTPKQYLQFEKSLDDLIRADQQLDLFEYALQKIVRRHLEPHFKPQKKTTAQYYAIHRLLAESETLLSALAHVGHTAPAEIQTAFRRGTAHLTDGAKLSLKPLAECSLADIDAALDRLNLAALPVKKELLLSCAHVGTADGMIQWREAELLRAIADTLDCPIPPFITGI